MADLAKEVHEWWHNVINTKDWDWDKISNHGETALQWYTAKNCGWAILIGLTVLALWALEMWVSEELGSYLKSNKIRWVQNIGLWLEDRHSRIYERVRWIAERNRKKKVAEAAAARARQVKW